MAETTIPFGSPLARKVYGAAVFAELTRAPGFTQRLTGPAPKQSSANRKLERMQTDAGYPFVRVTDLQRGRGDRVSIDLFNVLEGKPVMGDRRLSGKMMSLSANSMELTLNQFRGGVDTGGRMTRQRTVHDLRTLGRRGLAGWYARFLDQVKLVHLAGARGDEDGNDWVVPKASDSDFSEIMVNPVQAPTHNRHVFAGAASGIDTLTTTDIITIETLDMLRAELDETNVPLQPVRMEGDPAGADEPMWILYLSPRQYHIFVTRTGDNAIRKFQSEARERGASNPLFKGTVGMWNGILVKKLPRPIRFLPGSAVEVAQEQDTFLASAQTVPNFGDPDAATAIANGHAVDRAMLLGAQAAAEVWGRHGNSGTHMDWHEETTDHDAVLEASVAGMGGFGKLRFETSHGEVFDHGVYAVDSYAPDPRKIQV